MDRLRLALTLLAALALGHDDADDVATAVNAEDRGCGYEDALHMLQRKRRSGVTGGESGIAGAAVVDCTGLEVLDLSGSRIKTWPFAPAATCTQLQRLDLSDNFLQEVPEDAFVGMPNLVVLRLAYNRLSKFPNTTGLQALWELDLASNLITAVPPGALRENPEVALLDLSRNQLVELPSSESWLPEDNALDYMTVANNRISSLGANLFEHLSDLDWLDLSGNYLSTLNPESFDGVEDLDNLLLIGNPLECRIRIEGTCICAADCRANATDEDQGQDESEEEGEGENEDEDEDDEVAVKVPATWCKLPMCLNQETTANRVDNSSEFSGGASNVSNFSESSGNWSNDTVASVAAH